MARSARRLTGPRLFLPVEMMNPRTRLGAIPDKPKSARVSLKRHWRSDTVAKSYRCGSKGCRNLPIALEYDTVMPMAMEEPRTAQPAVRATRSIHLFTNRRASRPNFETNERLVLARSMVRALSEK